MSSKLQATSSTQTSIYKGSNFSTYREEKDESDDDEGEEYDSEKENDGETEENYDADIEKGINSLSIGSKSQNGPFPPPIVKKFSFTTLESSLKSKDNSSSLKPVPLSNAKTSPQTPIKTESEQKKQTPPQSQEKSSSIQEIKAKIEHSSSDEDKKKVCSQGEGSFFLMNERGELDVKSKCAFIFLVKEQGFEYYFQIYDGAGKLRLSQPVSSEMNLTYDSENHSLVWLLVLDGETYAWCFEFLNSEDEKDFKLKLAIANMEHSRQEDFSKMIGKQGDKDWVVGASESHQMYTTDDDKEKDDDYEFDFSELSPSANSKFEQEFKIQKTKQSPIASLSGAASSVSKCSSQERKKEDSESEQSGEDSEEEEEEDRSSTRKNATNTSKNQKNKKEDEKNNNMAVGTAINRTFVLRGSKIGVFKHNEDDELEYINKIPIIQTRDGDSFAPSQVMLHDSDTKMLMLHPDDKEKVFCMDLEQGEVVEEWKLKQDTKIRGFGPIEKYAQRSGKQMFLGVNNNSVFSVDPRQGKNRIAQQTSYAKPPFLSCVASTGDGCVAVGDKRGEIRLFNDISKRAKTCLPGLGDAIIGIDVTEDGAFILATTVTYLLVIPTALPSNKNGFNNPMGEKKPHPWKLQLHPRELVKYNIKKVQFTPAYFNTGTDVREKWIITSTGPFIVTWNLKSVRMGNTSDYKIKKCSSDVVADQFRFDKEDEVVVTLPDDVYLEKRSKVTIRKKDRSNR